MSDTTKARAIEKLNAITIKIGYPDTWRDYTDLHISTSVPYYENLQRVAKFAQDYSLSYLGKPVDKTKWYMTPQTVNAYYNPSSNEICFLPVFFNIRSSICRQTMPSTMALSVSLSVTR